MMKRTILKIFFIYSCNSVFSLSAMHTRGQICVQVPLHFTRTQEKINGQIIDCIQATLGQNGTQPSIPLGIIRVRTQKNLNHTTAHINFESFHHKHPFDLTTYCYISTIRQTVFKTFLKIFPEFYPDPSIEIRLSDGT